MVAVTDAPARPCSTRCRSPRSTPSGTSRPAGWDQPPRLFALVRTATCSSREPQLLAQPDRPTRRSRGALTAIEQEGLPRDLDLESLLGRIAWPADVDGCAFAVERVVVPPDAERDLPSDPDAAVEALAAAPGPPGRAAARRGAARRRPSICLLRQRAHDADDAVATGTDLAPGLVAALQATFATD